MPRVTRHQNSTVPAPCVHDRSLWCGVWTCEPFFVVLDALHVRCVRHRCFIFYFLLLILFTENKAPLPPSPLWSMPTTTATATTTTAMVLLCRSVPTKKLCKIKNKNTTNKIGGSLIYAHKNSSSSSSSSSSTTTTTTTTTNNNN